MTATCLSESDHLLAKSLGNDVLQSDERSAADEQDIGRVDLDVLLLRVFTSSLRRDVGYGPFEHLE